MLGAIYNVGIVKNYILPLCFCQGVRISLIVILWQVVQHKVSKWDFFITFLKWDVHYIWAQRIRGY